MKCKQEKEENGCKILLLGFLAVKYCFHMDVKTEPNWHVFYNKHDIPDECNTKAQTFKNPSLQHVRCRLK